VNERVTTEINVSHNEEKMLFSGSEKKLKKNKEIG
jgi:hypothetical protein